MAKLNTSKPPALDKGWIGPEHAGCIGTGLRPTVYKPRSFRKYAALNPKGYRYIVGPELFLDQAEKALLYGNVTGRTWSGSHKTETCRFYKHWRGAHTAWCRACEVVNQANRETAAEVTRLQEEMKSGDIDRAMKAALDLGMNY